MTGTDIYFGEEALKLLKKHETIAAAARSVGLSRETLRDRLRKAVVLSVPPIATPTPPGFTVRQLTTRLNKDGEVRSQSVQVRPEGLPADADEMVPEGHLIKGVSTLLGDDGTVRAQWIKTSKIRDDYLLEMLDAVRSAFASHERVPTIPAPVVLRDDLLTMYPMGDPHIGMYAWAEETGTDFDLDIAERNLIEATRRLVAASPASKQALIVNVGDFFHGDTSANRTLRSGHVLDIDTRWAKVLRIGVRTMRACIDAALEKHEIVRVINEIGNHDEHTSQAMTLALSLLYEHNPRVTFDMSPAKYHYHVFGKNLIGVTHGDLVKPEQLGGIMATDRPEDWGNSKFRVWLTGHVHNRRVFELPGCIVESFRTLAGKDSWTAASGYRAGRDMQSIVLHREFGERERHHVDISALDAK